nr:glycosyltransferase family 4 protein [uncultured Chryseobacterium sp.]
MITNKKLDCIDKILKKNLEKALIEKNFDLALRLIELSANLQYNYCFRETLYDKKLEDSLKTISDNFLETVTIDGDEETVMLYDYFGYDNRGLTQQYLRALRRLNKRIILVFENKQRQYKNEAILSEIIDYKNTSIYYLEGENRIEMAKDLFNIIITEKPKHILMHLIPWDSIAYLAFYKISGANRYQINLTDHTFWLGVDITDINIEFRSFGLNLSEQLRNIPAEKNRILPYYPILSKVDFQGFDFETKGKKIIFSGSTYYKILGDGLEFLQTIEELLKLDENLIFVFAGSGNDDTIQNFIKENKLEDRFYLIGDRYDLFEIMKRADYYICTFPLTGALMTQTAVSAQKPVFAYVNPKYLFNDLKDLFYKSDKFLNITTIDDLISSFKEIHFQKRAGNISEDMIINEEEFAYGLKNILKHANPMEFLEKRQNIIHSFKSFNTLMIESENLYNPAFSKTLDTYLSHWEKFRIIPNYRWKYYRKLLREDKIQFLKTFYYHITSKI